MLIANSICICPFTALRPHKPLSCKEIDSSIVRLWRPPSSNLSAEVSSGTRCVC